MSSLHRLLLSLIVCGSLLLMSCTQKPQTTNPDQLLTAAWSEIVQQAKRTKVTMYMWGGSETNNRYIDEWVAPRLQKEFGITLQRVPINDTKDIIHKLTKEKQADKTEGNTDIIWINGENFKTLKNEQLLWGAFAPKLPNVQQYVDQNAPDIRLDFGEETKGLEAPWGKAQFVFAYDQQKVKNPPKSMAELKQWVKQNPGKFTYPAPPDFTGGAFVRQALMELADSQSPTQVMQKTSELWSFLNEIEPYLWRGGKTYPESLEKLEQLYANGEVWMTMSYDPASATNQIIKGRFPSSTRTFILEQGTLSNTHYLSIPYNSSNPAGAMVAINFLLSPTAQIVKSDPKHWGEEMALDPRKLTAIDLQKLKRIDRGIATLSSEELAKYRLAELPASRVEEIEEGWKDHVAKK